MILRLRAKNSAALYLVAIAISVYALTKGEQ
jgi:hypothetical protein